MDFIYVVEIGYRVFKFANGTTALTFMEIAKAHASEDINVTMTLEVENEDD